MGVFDLGYCYARAVYTLCFCRTVCVYFTVRGVISWHGFSAPICRAGGAGAAASFLRVPGCQDWYAAFWFPFRQTAFWFP